MNLQNPTIRLRLSSRLFPLFFAVVTVILSTAAGAGVTTETATYHSAALDRTTTYIVALPSPLKPDHRYPVLYLLHGAYDNYRAWTDRTTITEELDGRDVIVIMPDGSEFGWYLDSSIKPANQYDTAISRDLIRDVESRYLVRTDRSGRAIAGLSMGGHGALSLAAKHPDLYSSASSLSGILNLSAHPGKWQLDDILGKQPSALPEWRRHSVLHLADTFSTADVALLFDTGLADKTGAVEDNQRLHEALTNRNIHHTYREYPGTHNWEYWRGHIGEHLDFHEDNFTTRSAGNAALKTIQGLPPSYTTKTLTYDQENRERWQRATITSDTQPIVLVGSSTFAATTSTLFPGYNVANRGIGADRLGNVTGFGILHRLYCSVFDLKPAAIFINNGTNDLYHTSVTGYPSVETAAEGFEAIVKAIRQRLPETPILIVSCHSTREKSAHIAPFLKPYNELTKALTGKYARVYYVDTYSATVGDDGLLNPAYSRDGLHLNQAGNELLARLAMEKLKEAGVHPAQ